MFWNDFVVKLFPSLCWKWASFCCCVVPGHNEAWLGEPRTSTAKWWQLTAAGWSAGRHNHTADQLWQHFFSVHACGLIAAASHVHDVCIPAMALGHIRWLHALHDRRELHGPMTYMSVNRGAMALFMAYLYILRTQQVKIDGAYRSTIGYCTGSADMAVSTVASAWVQSWKVCIVAHPSLLFDLGWVYDGQVSWRLCVCLSGKREMFDTLGTKYMQKKVDCKTIAFSSK